MDSDDIQRLKIQTQVINQLLPGASPLPPICHTISSSSLNWFPVISSSPASLERGGFPLRPTDPLIQFSQISFNLIFTTDNRARLQFCLPNCQLLPVLLFGSTVCKCLYSCKKKHEREREKKYMLGEKKVLLLHTS